MDTCHYSAQISGSGKGGGGLKLFHNFRKEGMKVQGAKVPIEH